MTIFFFWLLRKNPSNLVTIFSLNILYYIIYSIYFILSSLEFKKDVYTWLVEIRQDLSIYRFPSRTNDSFDFNCINLDAYLRKFANVRILMDARQCTSISIPVRHDHKSLPALGLTCEIAITPTGTVLPQLSFLESSTYHDTPPRCPSCYFSRLLRIRGSTGGLSYTHTHTHHATVFLFFAKNPPCRRKGFPERGVARAICQASRANKS